MTSRAPALALAGTLFLVAASASFPQETGCPPNAHLEGDTCRCDAGHVSLNGVDCVPESEVCSAYGAAHRVGADCVCNEGHAIFGGDQRCVSTSAHCGKFNAVFDPSTRDCRCRPGDGILSGESRCVSLAAVCARFDAVYSAAKHDCECPPGTVEDTRRERCVPATAESGRPAAPDPTPGNPAPSLEAPRREAPRQAPPVDPASEPRTPVPTREAVSPASATVGDERPAPSPGRAVGEAVSAPRPPAQPARTPSGGTDALPAGPRPVAVAPRPSAAGAGRLEGLHPAPASPPPKRVRSEPVIPLDSLSLLEETEISEEARELGRSIVLEAAANRSPAEEVAIKEQLQAFDSFMNADLSLADGEGEVQIGPSLDAMLEARRQSRVLTEHRKKTAEYRERVREIKAAGKLRPGVDRERYDDLKDSIERTRRTLAWATEEVQHQHRRLNEALHSDENDPRKMNFRLMGKEHAERFEVPVGQEKRYQGLSDDMVQAMASRDCFANIEGARKQMLAAREELRRQEANLESLLDLPEEPAIEDTDQEIIHWYSEERHGS